MKTFNKDPSAVLDFSIDWSGWLASGDSISTSTWSVATGITDDGGSTNVAGVTTVWLSGGTAGSAYDVTNTIVTADGRTRLRGPMSIKSR